LPQRGVAYEVRLSSVMASLLITSYTFLPTKPSTVARSSRFQVASPIHALVSPR
jgi:hypothetical protein